MDVAGFVLSHDADHDVLVTIPSSSLGPFDQPDVKEQIDGYWIDMSRVPHPNMDGSNKGSQGGADLSARVVAHLIGISDRDS